MSNKYEVVSDNFANHDKGATLTEKQLAHANIPALIEGGHLKDTNPKPKEK